MPPMSACGEINRLRRPYEVVSFWFLVADHLSAS